MRKGRVEPGIGDPSHNITAGDPNLVQHVTVGRDDRMV